MRHLLSRSPRDRFAHWKGSQSSLFFGSQAAHNAAGNDACAEGLLKPDHAGDAALTQPETIWERRSRSPSEPPVIQTDDAEEVQEDGRGYGPTDLDSENDEEEGKFLIGETARLSLCFCVLWVSNYLHLVFFRQCKSFGHKY